MHALYSMYMHRERIGAVGFRGAEIGLKIAALVLLAFRECAASGLPPSACAGASP